ncbi:hypothetical protein [Croceicoccus gelatinilyticus]|uniref:hypothetical protein n=1 Tax=Croceicoccus gelatinilyticus TaxID=2835536 RepID=UPI001BCF5D0B|nr:hypothetical protein [Croceicoccus gelatinilyticus]MBS7671521.1 hypothetical protein [Croceicoccus gelatinilyticus]
MNPAIPVFPFFEAPDVEMAFGCPIERYLDVSKGDAEKLLELLPEEAQMTQMLMNQGHLGEEQFGMTGRTYGVDATPEVIRKTVTALLRSFAPHHEIKAATVAVALHNWFPKAAGTQPA